ncbi:hypothetical protein [Streptomyces sp. NPDC047014]|uniref:hypothetical protein n=1 Tax=Streptomyces sp. NPDC047014 TaxID=3155736 RepID=UPI0033CE6169
MSFGDPHNPYGQQPSQPPQGQPGYGYPQQAPPGIPPQSGYAYPQQAPMGYPGGPGGYPGGYGEMPGGAKAARVILWILGILQLLAGLFVTVGLALLGAALSGSTSSSANDAGAAAGIMGVIVGVLVIGVSLWPILTAAKMAKGGNGVRISGIIYGSLQVLFAGVGMLINLMALGASENSQGGLTALSVIPSLISLALGITVVVGLAKSGAWFHRPRY